MDGELTQDIIDNVLETLQAYCTCREECVGCRYSFWKAGRKFPLCVFVVTPDNWKLEKVEGDGDE